MAVTCTNLEMFPTSAESATNGKMTMRWKCNVSNVKSHELYVEYFSVSKKQWVTDTKSTVSHQPINQYVTATYTSPDAATASALHFVVRPLLERTVTDAKGNEKTEQYYGDYATSAQVAAPQWNATASTGEKSKMKWQTTAPEAPTVTVSNATSQITVTVKSAANNRIGSVEIQRSVDGGAWAAVKEDYRPFTTNAKSDGREVYERDWGAWTYTYKDTAVEDGHRYAYRARMLNMTSTCWAWEPNASSSSGYYYYFSKSRHLGKAGAWSATAGYTRKPARPTNFKAQLANENSVALSWTQEGKTGDAYEVQWSSYVGINPSTGKNDNAWSCGAFDEISTMEIQGSASKATVSGLEKGVTWYFRVLRKNDAGSAWAGYVGSDGKVYWTSPVKVPAAPAPKISKPTGLTHEKATIEGEPAVILKWTDLATLEDGASYQIEHSTYANAWANNAADLIDSKSASASDVAYSGASKRYTWTGLERGKTHYFKLLKVGDGTTSVYADGYVKVAVAAQGTSLTAPAWGSVTSKEGGRALVSWTGTALGSGESFQVEYTDYSLAFTQNSLDDIQEASLESSSGSSHNLTVSGLEAGDWWFRVRRRSETAVSEWTSTKKLTVPMLSAGTLKQPKALKAARSGDTVTLTWDDDVLEAGAIYQIEHATRSDAWTLNVASAVTTDETSGDFEGRSGARRKYSYEGLEAGKTHYFRLFKYKEGYARVEAKNGVQAVSVPSSSVSLETPTNLAASAVNGRLVLTWESDTALQSGESFQIAFAPYEEAFELNDLDAIKTTELAESDGTSHVITLSQAAAGSPWYARVRRSSSDATSEWTEVVGVDLPVAAEAATESLGAPTAGQTLAAYRLGGDVLLTWTHNSGDGSAQTAWQVEIGFEDGTAQTITGEGQLGAMTSTYVTPSELGAEDGDALTWRVRTQGAYAGYWSPWSRVQLFRAFADPLAGIALADPLTAYPLEIEVGATSQSGLGLPDGNGPLTCFVEIAPTEDIETTTRDGSTVTAAAGETVWSGFYDRASEGFADGSWTVALTAADVRLVGMAGYEVRAAIVTEAGMKAEASATFAVEWDAELPAPSCSASFDAESLSCRIWPWCEEMVDDGAQGGGDPDEPVFALVDGVTLSVWRVLQDGSAELVADGIANDGESYADDPRCAFGTCTYRVVAESADTGAQSVDEFTVDTPCAYVVVDWPGNRVMLQSNATWAESHAPDVVHVGYQGRRDPVAYWGTPRGHTATVRASLLDGYDGGNFAKLRQLADYRGTSFIRDPSGMAWAATVVPRTLSGSARSPKRDVELSVTRVES